MSAMPERVQKYLCAWEGGLLLIDEGFGPDVFVKHNDYAALESRLLAAEALVPLLRYFVEYVEDGMYEWEDPKAPDHACDFLDNPESGYCEFHDKWGEARAILAREET